MSELKPCTYDDMIDGDADTNIEYYLKSEADKVIAHQKFKRCLAMARWCAAERDIYHLIPQFGKMKFYTKWRKRWLELAEKFKEVK